MTAEDPTALPGLGRLAGLVRTVRTPEFAGTTFHEVQCRSALNRVAGSSPAKYRLPFRWTINPYRGLHPRLRLLLRPADPLLSRARPGTRLRQPDRGEDQFGFRAAPRAGARELVARTRGHGHQHRPVPARRGPLPADARRHRRPRRERDALLHPHQGHAVEPGPAVAGRGGTAGAGRYLHFPGGSRSPTAARSGARHPDAAGPAGAHPPDPGGRTALRRTGGADPAGPHRRSRAAGTDRRGAGGGRGHDHQWRRSASPPGSPGMVLRLAGAPPAGPASSVRAVVRPRRERPVDRTGARSRSASGPSWTAPGWRAGNSAAQRAQTHRRHPLSRPDRSWASQNCSDGSVSGGRAPRQNPPA